MKNIIGNISDKKSISLSELDFLLNTTDTALVEELFLVARKTAQSIYGNKIFIRGLIEFTNYCKNDCYYCGIRRSNACAERYRLSKEEIIYCANNGYELGFRTIVLQGGEDPFFTDDKICDIVAAIKANHPDSAITLSIGEKPYESYKAYKQAGADRFLLRHETADSTHYASLHPAEMSFENRLHCLRDLKALGYQVGCGFMVSSPGQSVQSLHQDLMLIKELKPHMVGIGPFIPQKDTPFGSEPAGTLEQTLRLLAIIRLIHPHVLLPATTALGTIHPQGREKGILAGANVVMPNLSPTSVRAKYSLYDNKICTGDEAAECLVCLKERINKIGYEITVARGDFK